MHHRRISSGEWRNFFAEFSAGHRGWKTAVELIDPGRIRRRLAEGDSLVDVKGAGDADPNKVAIRLKGQYGNDRTPIVVESVDSAYFIDFGPGMDSIVQLERRDQPSVLVHVWQNPYEYGL